MISNLAKQFMPGSWFSRQALSKFVERARLALSKKSLKSGLYIYMCVYIYIKRKVSPLHSMYAHGGLQSMSITSRFFSRTFLAEFRFISEVRSFCFLACILKQECRKYFSINLRKHL